MATSNLARSLVLRLLLAYSVFYALYMLFVALLTLGPEDFNGRPNPASVNIVGGLLVAGSVAQVVVASMLVRQPSFRKSGLLLAIAYAALLIFIIQVGSRAILEALPPAVNCVVLTVGVVLSHRVR